MNKIKTLFFIKGSLPSEEDFKKASEIEGKVCFRNADMIGGGDEKLEVCDFVTGIVPDSYSEIPEYSFESENKEDKKVDTKQEVKSEAKQANPGLVPTKVPANKQVAWTPNA